MNDKSETVEENQSLTHFLDRAEDRFTNAPIGILFNQEKSYALQLFAANEYLEKVALKSPFSLLAAMSNVASIGLSLNPAKKQAYLVPRKGKICLDPSYMGMVDLAIQSGMLVFVQAKIVCENDTYTNKGVDREPVHEYSPFGDRGALIGVYCVAKTARGDYLTTEMDKAKIDEIKGRSESGKQGKGPWMTDYNEMAKKTVMRNAFKTWPKTDTMDRLAMAVELSNQNEAFESLVTSPELDQYTDEQKKYFDQMIESSDAIGMFCFIQSIDAGIYMALYNSFASDITKYKRIVGDLEKSGGAQVLDCKQEIESLVEAEDEMGAKQVIEDLSTEAVNFIIDKTDDETRKFIQGLGE
jgi:phage RecT family recombinase|tara:strand:+ start:684 stop:1748 length:1065 start_codon:yes stop_codon:yes gene_type:complete